MEITRRKSGTGFMYRQGATRVTDKATLKRIKALVIPPAWQDVTIAGSPTAKIQAKGRDAAGRLQAIYNPAFRQKQEAKKFAKISDFALKLPRLRKQLEYDLRRRALPKDKVLACVVTLIDQAYFRVGNEKYAKENNSYGITTMRSKHVDFKGESVIFDFMGKSNKRHHKVISDRRLSRIIRQLDEQPGYEIFRYQDSDGTFHDITSAHINAYIKECMGSEFSAKNFRTWGGTLIAIEALAASELAISERERKKIITQCVKKVSRRLGNTPAIARGSYIDPHVFEQYLGGADFRKVKATISAMRPKKYLLQEERYALKILGAATK